MRAGDIMTFGAAAVAPDAPIEEAARLMLQHRVSGLPVVGNDDELVGIITEGDLLRRTEGGADRPRWLELLLRAESAGGGAQFARAVKDVMTADLVTADEDTPVQEIADRMQRHGVKRVPVVREGKVVGIVSRADLLRGLARDAELMRYAGSEDRALREAVLAALGAVPKAGWRSLNVTVRDGAVELRGAVGVEDERQNLVDAARGVSGVTDVTDRLVVVGSGSGRS